MGTEKINHSSLYKIVYLNNYLLPHPLVLADTLFSQKPKKKRGHSRGVQIIPSLNNFKILNLCESKSQSPPSCRTPTEAQGTYV